MNMAGSIVGTSTSPFPVSHILPRPRASSAYSPSASTSTKPTSPSLAYLLTSTQVSSTSTSAPSAHGSTPFGPQIQVISTSSSSSPPSSSSPSHIPLAHLPDRTMPPPSTIPRKRKLAPHPASSPSPSISPTPDPPEDEDEDDEYAPASSVSVKKTRHASNGQGGNAAGAGGGGGKGANGRTMSREALRKANHSMIERRRREKINAALGDLRDMVPGLGGETKGGEFKLEVLERTVAYMRELKATIAELEAKVASSPRTTFVAKHKTIRSKSEATSEETLTTTTTTTTDHSPPKHKTLPPLPAFPQDGRKPHYFLTNSKTPPSPSLSPDPNETEPECNLPPAFTIASRQVANTMSGNGNGSAPGTPTIASLLHSANTEPHRQPSRPAPGPQASNPTLYLPFPTPSPTSPFLTYHTSSSSSTSSGLPEPSPFLAPMQNISLFGGALNLDAGHAPGAMGDKGKDMRPEEAANLLLAFSSPDVLRPVTGLQMTPKMIPVEAADNTGSGGMAGMAGMGIGMKRERRGTLDSEEFVLDGGLVSGGGKSGVGRNGIIGKTARDILKM